MKKQGYVSLFLLVILFTAACTPQAAPATPTPTELPPAITLTISGSGSVTPILTAIADAFEADNPGYVLEVLPGSGTGGGVTGTVDGTFDVAAMSRPAKDSEAEQGIQYMEFGTSVTVIMTHPEVGVTDLTSDQVAGIFTGAITNWSEVGGPDLEIVVYVRDPEESNTSDIREAFVGEDAFVAAAQVMTSQTDMQNVLASVKGAIGYGTWATALANEADVVSVAIDGQGVDDAPKSLVGAMGIGYLADRTEDVQPLIDWLTSEHGRSALAAIGVTPAASA